MALLMGIDLGTSGVRAVVIDEGGAIRAVGAREYPIDTPQPGWAEQNPDTWLACTHGAIREALEQDVDVTRAEDLEWLDPISLL